MNLVKIRNFCADSRRFFASLAIFLAFMIVLGAVFSHFAFAVGENSVQKKDQLVTIYDDGVARTILTDEKNVAKILDQSEIAVSAADKISPAQKENLPEENAHITIFRARPVVILSGSEQTRVISAAQNPNEIVRDAGFDLQPEDKIISRKVSDVLGSNGPGMELEIKYSDVIYRVATEEIPFATKKIDDETKKEGEKSVAKKGKKGAQETTYKIRRVNGRIVGRERISAKVTARPVDQIVKIGAKPETPPGPSYNPNGTHEEWMRAAGIAEENFPYAEFLVARESGWNPNARNALSGACGLPQALPCSKLGDNWNNPIVALSWMNDYVARHGGWAGAYNFWQNNHWY